MTKELKEKEVAVGRRARSDALRNEDAVLDAAKAVFGITGVDAPVREIAIRAGVGIATVYRRFPKRSDLVAGVFRREVDNCAAEATKLAATFPPLDALIGWLQSYTNFLATKKGLAAALHSGDPAFDALPNYFRTNFEPALTDLLSAAANAGEIRSDISAYDLLHAIGALSITHNTNDAGQPRSMVNLLIDGLRYIKV